MLKCSTPAWNSPLVVRLMFDWIELFHDSACFSYILKFVFRFILIPLRYADISFIFSFVLFFEKFLNHLNAPNSGLQSDLRKFITSKKIKKKSRRMNMVGRWTERTMASQLDAMEPWKFIGFKTILCPKYVDGSPQKFSNENFMCCLNVKNATLSAIRISNQRMISSFFFTYLLTQAAPMFGSCCMRLYYIQSSYFLHVSFCSFIFFTHYYYYCQNDLFLLLLLFFFLVSSSSSS